MIKLKLRRMKVKYNTMSKKVKYGKSKLKSRQLKLI